MRTLLDASTESLLVTIGIVACVAALITGVIFYFAGKRSYRLYTTKIVDSSNSLRVFVIDVKNDSVRYFNRSKLKKRRFSSMTDFYNQFPSNEREKLIDWIGDLIDPDKTVPNYLEINVIVSRNHRNYFSLLQVGKIDREKQLIYIESYLLKYMFASRKNSKVASNRFTSEESFSHQLSHSNNKGYTFAINFFNKKVIGQPFPRYEFSQIKNVLVKYIEQKRLMLEYDEHQIIICDFKVNAHSQFMQLFSTIKNEINKFLTISSSMSDVGFSVGVVENRFFPGEATKVIETCLNLSKLAQDDNVEIIQYEEGRRFDGYNDTQHYRTEVERIVQDKRLKYLYRPIYNRNRNIIDGYQMFIETLDSFFDNINELKSYAIRTEDDHELFATIARTGISKFIQENTNPSYRLYFPITLNEINYVNRTLSHIAKIKETRIVLVIDENELTDFVDDQDVAFLASVRSFKSKGFEVALAINDNELTCSPLIYEAFDMFILSVKGHINRKNASRSMPSFQRLIEKLLHFKKTIIATDIPAWDILELVIKFGVDIVSSEAISPMAENVLPISKKTIDKIKKIQL